MQDEILVATVLVVLAFISGVGAYFVLTYLRGDDLKNDEEYWKAHFDAELESRQGIKKNKSMTLHNIGKKSETATVVILRLIGGFFFAVSTDGILFHKTIAEDQFAMATLWWMFGISFVALLRPRVFLKAIDAVMDMLPSAMITVLTKGKSEPTQTPPESNDPPPEMPPEQ